MAAYIIYGDGKDALDQFVRMTSCVVEFSASIKWQILFCFVYAVTVLFTTASHAELLRADTNQC